MDLPGDSYIPILNNLCIQTIRSCSLCPITWITQMQSVQRSIDRFTVRRGWSERLNDPISSGSVSKLVSNLLDMVTKFDMVTKTFFRKKEQLFSHRSKAWAVLLEISQEDSQEECSIRSRNLLEWEDQANPSTIHTIRDMLVNLSRVIIKSSVFFNTIQEHFRIHTMREMLQMNWGFLDLVSVPMSDSAFSLAHLSIFSARRSDSY